MVRHTSHTPKDGVGLTGGTCFWLIDADQVFRHFSPFANRVIPGQGPPFHLDAHHGARFDALCFAATRMRTSEYGYSVQNVQAAGIARFDAHAATRAKILINRRSHL